MAQGRRASLNFTPKAVPYQIYHTNKDTGKNVQGTKRRLCWRFGWTDSEQEHEVDLKHSLLSGKKTIYEDGREIVSTTQGMFSSEFSHGWESGGHVFRVEINSGISADTEYYFTIDGVKFHDFQKKPSSITPAASNPPRQTAPRPSQPTAPTSTTKKAEFQTKPRSGSFDPFSASASATPAAPAAEVDFFGSNDSFGGSSSDPFGKPSTPAASSSDPFGSSNNGFSDPFGAPQPAASKPADDFFSAPASKPAATDTFNDFSGLTYTPAPPSSMMQQPRQQQNMSMNATPPPPAPAAQQAPKDPWSSLVNLDLSNKQAPSAAQAASVRGGPTLNQMGPSTTTGSASFKPVGDPFASVSGPSYGGQPAYGAQQQQPAYQQQPANRQAAISSMGDPFAAASNPYGMQGTPYGAGSQGGYGAQAPNAYGRPPAQNQKTSLDNLDWKF